MSEVEKAFQVWLAGAPSADYNYPGVRRETQLIGFATHLLRERDKWKSRSVCSCDAQTCEAIQELERERDEARRRVDKVESLLEDQSIRTQITPELREQGEQLMRAWDHNMFGLEDDLAQWARDVLYAVTEEKNG